ncbi:MAG TPA: hypothetical protein VIM57_02990 [Luteolibacter sp.]
MSSRLITTGSSVTAALLLSNCAWMFQGTTSQVAFTSKQPGGTVQVENVAHPLPATVPISKKTTTATFSHPKYPAKTLTWKRKYQWGFFWLDFLFSPGYGVSGWIIDGSTGAWWEQPRVIDYDFKTGRTSVPLDEKKATQAPEKKPQTRR